jgi:hypothetical protein
VKRPFAVLVVLFFAPASMAGGAPLLPSGPAYTGPAAAPHPAVVRVIAPDRGGMSLGSGTLVAVEDRRGIVVTNWHVVRDAAGPLTVLFPDGFRSAGVVLKTDRYWDLAAIAIERPAVAPVPLADLAPRRGDVLTIAGYGPGKYRAASGRCTQYYSPGARLPFEIVELSTAARQGDSGGPIFNARGELAGVLFGATSRTTSGAYCGRVAAFLTSAGIEPGERPLYTAALPADAAPAGPPAEGTWNVGARRFDADVGGAGVSQMGEDAHQADAVPAAVAGGAGLPTPIGRSATPTVRLPPVEEERTEEARRVAEAPRAAEESPPLAAVLAGPAVEAEGIGAADSSAGERLEIEPAAPRFLVDAFPWQALTGATPLEQAKSYLAILAILMIAVQGWRAIGGGREPAVRRARRKASPARGW